jgi:hypothetical protein
MDMRDIPLRKNTSIPHSTHSDGEQHGTTEAPEDIDQCIVEIIRALARAAARRDHREDTEPIR